MHVNYINLILSPLPNHRYTGHSHFIYIYYSSQIFLHVHWHTDMLTLYTVSLLHGYSTPLFHVLISPFYGHSNTLYTIFHINTCYTRYCCPMYMSHYYIDTEMIDTIIACSWIIDTQIRYYNGYVTWILCAQLLHVLTPLLHRLTDTHVLIVSVFFLHGSLFILHELLLHDILVLPLHDCFPLLILIFRY